MTGQHIGYQNQNFSFSADISVGIPESGFQLAFGKKGSVDPPFDPFTNVVEFSGVSGYLFDQSGRFFGGYQKNKTFTITGDVFHTAGDGNRFSYGTSDYLVANNVEIPSGFIDSVIFEDYDGQNTLIMDLNLETGSPVVLADNTGLYLLSSEGYYLAGA